MIVRFNAESRQVLLAAAGVIPVFAKKRLSQKSSGRPSRRSRTLPAFGTGVTSLRGDTPAPSSSIVAEAFATPSHPAITHVPQGRSSASAARCLVSAILLIMAVACSRPGSWEQFVRAEERLAGCMSLRCRCRRRHLLQHLPPPPTTSPSTPPPLPNPCSSKFSGN